MRTRGFTLVEMIVALGLFAIVMTIAMAAFFNLLTLDREVRSTNDVVDNLNFAVDSMQRSIQTGTNYQCGGSGGTNCWGTGSNAFTFTDYQNRTVTYRLITTGANTGSIGRCTTLPCTGASSGLIPLTDPRITIQKLTFYVRGVGTSDTLEPQVLFTISGTMKPDAKTPAVNFTIENEATQRFLEL